MSPVSGSKRRLVLVSAGLHRRGGGVAVVGRLTGRALADLARREGRGFDALDLGPGDDSGASGVPNVTCFEGSQARLAVQLALAHLRRPTPAVFFDHLGPARIQAWLPGSVRAPYAVWLHGIEVWRPLSGDRRRALEGAALLVANSRFTWERAVEFNPWLSGRPHRVVHLAVENAMNGPATEDSPQLEQRPPYFLMVGRLSASERYKGHDETIEAFSRVVPGFPQTQLLIVGDGDDRARLEDLAARMPEGRSIHFEGFVEDRRLDALIAGCRALVLPSTGEGFGLVFIEALKHGRPFVACSGTVAEEVAGTSGSAALVPSGDAGALAEALRGLLADPARCDLMGSAGRAVVASAFTEEAFRARFLAAVSPLI